MFLQVFRFLVFLWVAYVYPCAVKRVAHHFLPVGDKFLNEVGSIEECVGWYQVQGAAFDQIYPCIRIIVVLRFLQKPLDVTSVEASGRHRSLVSRSVGSSTVGISRPRHSDRSLAPIASRQDMLLNEESLDCKKRLCSSVRIVTPRLGA